MTEKNTEEFESFEDIWSTILDERVLIKLEEKVEDMNPATLLEGVPWDFETFPDYLDSVSRRGTVLNYGAYIGHTALRLYAMGEEATGRPANEAELEAMAAIIRDAMDAGAVGFATSFAQTHLGADGSYKDLLYYPVGPSKDLKTAGTDKVGIIMRGNEVFKVAVKTLGRVAEEALKANNIDKSELDWLIPHQEGRRQEARVQGFWASQGLADLWT